MTVANKKIIGKGTTKAAEEKSVTLPPHAPPPQKISRIGIKEFRDKATQLLAQDIPFAIERHGQVIGFYTPLGGQDPAEAQAARTRYAQTMNGIARRLSLSRAELDELLWGENA